MLISFFFNFKTIKSLIINSGYSLKQLIISKNNFYISKILLYKEILIK